MSHAVTPLDDLLEAVGPVQILPVHEGERDTRRVQRYEIRWTDPFDHVKREAAHWNLYQALETALDHHLTERRTRGRV